MREQFERQEEARLAPYALRSAGATRRYRVENEGRAFDYRTHFQRDRDRVVYCRAFRRLRQKALTGVLPAYEDHRRNRLTHTLEVTQLARTIGRALQLNEDLIEAVALGHDLGQPPFGPTGERALDDLLSGRLDGRGGAGLGDLGGFRRPWQSLKVVDRLEKRYAHPGLNLTDAVREGILKSGSIEGAAIGEVQGIRAGLAPALEVQTVRLADRVAAALHDLDDALQAGAIDVVAVERLGLVGELRKKLGASYPARASRFMKANTIHRGLVHLLVTGTILASSRHLARWAAEQKIERAGDFAERRDEAVRGDEVRLTRPGARMLEDLEGYLAGRLHRGRAADEVEGRGRRALLGLFAAYHADPILLDDHVLLRYKEARGVRFLRDLPPAAREAEIARRYRPQPGFATLLADHLAAMTDTFALREHARLLELGAVPIPSAEQLRRERSEPGV